jgi:cytidylate kinase
MGAENKPIVIAIDGPAGAGKGTLARRLADAFSLAYLDTGALYRAVGFAVLEQGGDPANAQTAAQVAENLNPAELNNPRLREERSGKAASVVAAHPAVRQALLEFQRRFAEMQPAGVGGAVLDGRDIGTVVCPDAQIKVFLKASLAIRVKRRVKELQDKGQHCIEEEVYQDMKARDERDSSRTDAPLAKADDAFVMDASDKNADQVFAAVIAHVRQKLPFLP